MILLSQEQFNDLVKQSIICGMASIQEILRDETHLVNIKTGKPTDKYKIARKDDKQIDDVILAHIQPKITETIQKFYDGYEYPFLKSSLNKP